MGIEVTESETLPLDLVLSKPRTVKWFRSGELISTDDERFQTTTRDDGKRHTLTISNVTVDDSGIIEAKVEDNEYGLLVSSAVLCIKGWYTCTCTCTINVEDNLFLTKSTFSALSRYYKYETYS